MSIASREIILATDEIERFWSKVDTTGEGCWLWSTELNNHGYGVFATWRGGRSRFYAHRVAWTVTRGPIPHGQVIRHRCDVPACCNPDHMELGTQADNVRDSIDRGRADHSGLKAGWQAKWDLRDSRIAEVRRMFALGMSSEEIADALEVGRLHLYQTFQRAGLIEEARAFTKRGTTADQRKKLWRARGA